MLKKIRIASTLLVLALACGVTARPQETQGNSSASADKTPPDSSLSAAKDYMKSPERYFRLDFRVLELSAESKMLDSRSYSEMIASGPKSRQTSSIRSNDRVPSNNSYFNIGANFDANGAEVTDQTLALFISADVTTSSTTPPSDAGSTHTSPVIRNASWHSYVMVPIAKPTVIFSSDNSADRGKLEIELTAVPLSK